MHYNTTVSTYSLDEIKELIAKEVTLNDESWTVLKKEVVIDMHSGRVAVIIRSCKETTRGARGK